LGYEKLLVSLKVVIFDDVLAARGEHFHIPGLSVVVHGHADAAVEICTGPNRQPPDVIFMDFAMGEGHKNGAVAIRELREAGFEGRIIAISSDPNANAEMQRAGAGASLEKKAHLRSYLVYLGANAEEETGQ
jgi:DNA-binding NarL/FixJ family response regulator